MAIQKFNFFAREKVPEHASTEDSPHDYQTERKTSVDATDTKLQVEDTGDLPDDAQDGVKRAAATTIVWSRNSLILAYFLIFLIFYVNSLQQQVANGLSFYVTSSFFALPLTATTGVVSTIVAGMIKLPVAKLMDVWGRPQGYILMLISAVLGLILMAACRNVETYAAAQVFYWVGFDGIAYVLDVFLADTSSLKNRALMFAFSTAPFIPNVFAGPAAAQSFLRTSGWPWGFGTFAIIIPIISLPFLWVFWHNQQLAKQQGIILKTREASTRSVAQSIQHYLVEFDVIGILLICAGFSLLLLPLSLAKYQQGTWASGSIIAMFVIGFCCLIAFGVHEAFFSRKPFLPFHLLVDRTVLGSCLLSGTLWISFYCWDAFWLNYLQVVYNLDLQSAGYAAGTYSLGSCFFAIPIGILVRVSGRFKWIALIAVPLQILGTGLMIHFRQPDQGLGYAIMCQVFIAASGGALVITEQMAVMAAVGPENVATGLALQAAFTAVGGAVGISISGAIWTNVLPSALDRFLPESAKSQAALINADLVTQLSYPWGSPERNAIIQAYAYAQRYMCIAATAVLPVAFVWVLIWRDYRVKDFKPPAGSTVA